MGPKLSPLFLYFLANFFISIFYYFLLRVTGPVTGPRAQLLFTHYKGKMTCLMRCLKYSNPTILDSSEKKVFLTC